MDKLIEIDQADNMANSEMIKRNSSEFNRANNEL